VEAFIDSFICGDVFLINLCHNSLKTNEAELALFIWSFYLSYVGKWSSILYKTFTTKKLFLTYLWRKYRNSLSCTVLTNFYCASILIFNLITLRIAVDENGDRLCYYGQRCDNYLLTFRDYLSYQSSRFNELFIGPFKVSHLHCVWHLK
jgi:hypothetical protein